MQTMKKAMVALAIALAAGSAVARDAELQDVPPVTWGDATDRSLPQLRDRIVKAGQSLGWRVVKDEPGQLELHYDKRGRHQVNVAVRYDGQSYKIDYLNSVNLNFSEADGVRRIHPNYNRWIRNLIKQIGVV